MANLTAFLVIVSFVVFTNAQISYYRGGYFTWQHYKNENRVIEFDYTLFFDLNSEEASRCTADAIQKRTIFTSSTIRYALWTDLKIPLSRRPQYLERIRYYCVFKDIKVMKKVVVRFEKIKHRSDKEKFYLGIEAPNSAYRTYIYVDLTPRTDTKRINTSPTINMFPHYLIREREATKITIQAFDVDEDYIKCFVITSNGQQKPLTDCELIIPDSERNGIYLQQVIVADYRNKDQNLPLSYIKVVFEVSKLGAVNKITNKPYFSLSQPFTCVNHNDVDGSKPVRRTFDVFYTNEVRLNEMFVMGPPGITYKIDQQSGKNVIDFSWVPLIDQKGKHIVCFYASATEKSTNIVHVADPKCLYISVGREHTHVRLDLLYPTKEVRQDDFNHYKIKVYGAFERPTRQSYFALQNAKTDTLQYYIELSRESRLTFTYENNIELRSDEIRPVPKGQDYQIRLTSGLFKAQARCAVVPSISPNGADYVWKFRVLSDSEEKNIGRTTTTTITTTTMATTTTPPKPEIVRPTETGTTVRPSGKRKYITKLTCQQDGFQLRISPFENKLIKKITLFDDKCKMINFSGVYSVNSKYSECNTSMIEEANHILFKNVAIVHMEDVSGPVNSAVTRAKTYKIGLECRLPRSSVNTVKGKRVANAPSNMQQIQFDSIESAEGSFGIDFDVYKTNRYIEAYSPAEFPIHVAKDSRMFFEISLDRDNLNLIPQNCYATKVKDHNTSIRHYIIENRCQKDTTYQQHRQTYNQFRFSIQSFAFKDSNTMYIHCKSLVCHDTTSDKCNYGCNKGKALSGRFGRSIETKKNGRRVLLNNKTVEYDEIETFVTSTLQIQITEDKPTEKTDLTKILLFAQIPIALLLVTIIFFAWRCFQQRKTGGKSKQMYYEEDEKLTPGKVAM